MAQRSENHITVEIQNKVMYLTLNRPNQLNAISSQMIKELKRAILQARSDSGIKVISISGSGRAFCAGGDVKKMGSRDALETYQHLGEVNELILIMRGVDKPIVASVHGYAVGAGFSLALACDVILASKDSKFNLGFSKVGLTADGGVHYFLSKVIGPYRLKELLFNAEPISAEVAHEWGIVNHIYSADMLEIQTNKYLSKLSNGPSATFSFTKKIVNQASVSNLKEILEQERITQSIVSGLSNHQEGIQAFKEKREPDFNI